MRGQNLPGVEKFGGGGYGIRAGAFARIGAVFSLRKQQEVSVARFHWHGDISCITRRVPCAACSDIGYYIDCLYTISAVL